jgi:hypothetical protein
MSNVTKIALSAAIILSTAFSVLTAAKRWICQGAGDQPGRGRRGVL